MTELSAGVHGLTAMLMSVLVGIFGIVSLEKYPLERFLGCRDVGFRAAV